VDALLRTSQHEFAIVDRDGGLDGVLTRDSLLGALRKTGSEAPVESAMRRDIPVVASNASGEECVRLLQGGAPAVAVQGRLGKLLGLITLDNLMEAMLVSNATRRDAAAPGSGHFRGHEERFAQGLSPHVSA
jgi:Mg/Co/Ni transporter MgtE